MNKSILINDVKSLVDKLRRNKKKIVFTNGCFDIIHPGHIHLLKKSKFKYFPFNNKCKIKSRFR